MKRVAFAAVGFLLIATWAAASPATTSWDGWISESKCGAKGANAGAAECTKKCLKEGAAMVVVTDDDQKVLTVQNPDALKEEGKG